MALMQGGSFVSGDINQDYQYYPDNTIAQNLRLANLLNISRITSIAPRRPFTVFRELRRLDFFPRRSFNNLNRPGFSPKRAFDMLNSLVFPAASFDILNGIN